MEELIPTLYSEACGLGALETANSLFFENVLLTTPHGAEGVFMESSFADVLEGIDAENASVGALPMS